MKRTPLKRKTPMSRSRQPLPKVSPKRAILNRQYAKACREWRAGHDGRCEMNFRADTMEHSRRDGTDAAHFRCLRSAMNQPHHSKGRGPFLCDKSTFRGLCLPCHDWIHQHPNQARALGWLEF